MLKVMDVLSTLLSEVRADGAVFARNLLENPWALRFEDGSPLTLVVMLRGSGAVVLDDGAHRPLAEGDIAVVSGGHAFSLTDGSGDPGPARYVRGPGGTCTVEAGAASAPALASFGARTCGDAHNAPNIVLTGSYDVRSPSGLRLIGALPPVLVVPDEGDLCPVMELTVAEVERVQPGQQAVLNRLLDLLLISTLREWFAQCDEDAPGWYRALSDPLVGPVLRTLHDVPGETWTVSRLAEVAGVSRATLARRFAELVGETPMAYLTTWRLSLAADLLRTTDLTVDSIARQVGYQSGFGLSVAFKRVFGTRPSEVRRRTAA